MNEKQKLTALVLALSLSFGGSASALGGAPVFSRKNKVPRTPPTKPKLGFFISGLNKYIFNIIYNRTVRTEQELRRRDVLWSDNICRRIRYKTVQGSHFR